MANKSIEVDEFVHEQDDSRLVNDQIADVPKEISISPKDQQISSSKDQGQIPSLMSLDWGQIPSLMSLDRGQLFNKVRQPIGRIDDDNYLYGRTEVIINWYKISYILLEYAVYAIICVYFTKNKQW